MTALEYILQNVAQQTDRTIWWKMDVFATRKAHSLEINDLLDAMRQVATDRLITQRNRSPDLELEYDERNGHLVAILNIRRGDILPDGIDPCAS